MPLIDKAASNREQKRRKLVEARKAGMVRVAVNLPEALVAIVDDIKREHGFQNRDQALAYGLTELLAFRDAQDRRSEP